MRPSERETREEVADASAPQPRAVTRSPHGVPDTSAIAHPMTEAESEIARRLGLARTSVRRALARPVTQKANVVS